MDDLDAWELLYKIEAKLNLSFDYRSSDAFVKNMSEKPLVSELVKQTINKRTKENANKEKNINRIITYLKSNLLNKKK